MQGGPRQFHQRIASEFVGGVVGHQTGADHHAGGDRGLELVVLVFDGHEQAATQGCASRPMACSSLARTVSTETDGSSRAALVRAARSARCMNGLAIALMVLRRAASCCRACALTSSTSMARAAENSSLSAAAAALRSAAGGVTFQS